jgi:hypothetical protein
MRSRFRVFCGECVFARLHASCGCGGAFPRRLCEQVTPGPVAAVVFLPIDPRNATLTVASPLDFEATPSFTVHLSVRTSFGAVSNGTAVVVVQDVNDAPVFAEPFPTSVSVPEDAVVGTVVVRLPAVDADGDLLIFTAASPDDAAAIPGTASSVLLRVDPSTGTVVVAAPLDFERRQSFVLDVTASDRSGAGGLATTRTVTVTVTDVNDIRVTDVSPAVLSTLGGETVLVTGTDFGRALATGQPSTAAVAVTYGPRAAPARFNATNCAVVDGNVAVQCTSAAGAGGDLVWTVCVDGVCGLPSALVTSYTPPVVTSVLVPAGVFQTRGGDVFTLFGTDFGDPADVSVNASVVVSYAPGGQGPAVFTAAHCALQPRAGDAAPGDASGAIVCTSVEGAGADLLWRVTVAGLASEWSDPSTAVRYAAPEVVAVAAPLLRTLGGDAVALTVTNGGPGGAAFPVRARYGYVVTVATHDHWYGVPCTVVVPHTQLQCVAAPGSGAGLAWEVLVGGQWSAVPTAPNTTASYAPPTVTGLSGDQLLSLSTFGNQVVTLHGVNFGPAVAPGDTLRAVGLRAVYADGAFTAAGCTVTVPHLAITCTTAPGTGRGHGWRVVVAYQSSPEYFHDFGNGEAGTRYAPPTVASFRLVAAPLAPVTALATEGGEGIAIVGRNFGPSIATLSSVAYTSAAEGGVTFAVDVGACAMSVPHEEITCATVPGAGAGMQWLLVVDGQVSTNPSTAYAPPEVHGVVAAAPGVDVGALSTNGGSEVFVVGASFGPVYEAGNRTGVCSCVRPSRAPGLPARPGVTDPPPPLVSLGVFAVHPWGVVPCFCCFAPDASPASPPRLPGVGAVRPHRHRVRGDVVPRREPHPHPRADGAGCGHAPAVRRAGGGAVVRAAPQSRHVRGGRRHGAGTLRVVRRAGDPVPGALLGPHAGLPPRDRHHHRHQLWPARPCRGRDRGVWQRRRRHPADAGARVVVPALAGRRVRRPPLPDVPGSGGPGCVAGRVCGAAPRRHRCGAVVQRGHVWVHAPGAAVCGA